MTTYGIYLYTVWQAIQKAEASGFHSFAQALRCELAAEMMRARRQHFVGFVLSL